jgi:hypothetical protein
VTPESFAKWKKTRMDKKDAETEAVRKAKEAQHLAGKSTGMSGRDLVRPVSSLCFLHTLCSTYLCPTKFQFNPEWFEDEDGDAEEEWDLDKYRKEQEEENLAEEEKRIADLKFRDGVNEGDAEGSGGGRG